ncbi:MAG: SDR family oxidoreductase [Candidatus Thorarchaeota archaeon]
MKLANETAIVTGSTSGIGKKLAELLLREGCQVAICSRNEQCVQATVDEFKGQFGDSVIGFPCDVSDPASVKNLIDQTMESFGSIKILVANAGINTVYGPLEHLPLEEVASHAQKMINVNLLGMIHSISAVLPQMVKQKYGRIITLSGGGADRPLSHMTLYSASKGGVVAFSQCIAEEFKERDEDIKINIFQPGMIRTNLGHDIQLVNGWISQEEFERNTTLVHELMGSELEESCSKVIPFVLPSSKKNGDTIRGFSLRKMISGGRKLQKAMKK